MSSRWSKVEELFHAALERAPAEREAFLREACGGDEDLRREVQSLLAEEREADRLMEGSAADAATQKVAVTRGTRLGPYEVLGLLGAGGMGEVYRATDTRLGREVAVKVLPADFASDKERLRRFEREARAVASLSHPHIASLFDVGHTDGTHYLVMELVDGETLASRLKKTALAEGEALRIGAEIAEALAAAHAQGVVHRDVKPANVMLTRSGAKLLDFGLARRQGRADAAGETVTSLTEEGVVAGTVPYMAPEQLEGREADARTDIWALGCVLYEMLAGRRAFEGDSQARLIAAIEKDDAPRLPPPATSPALDRLVRQCLQKDPARRWQSAADVGLRLREIAEAESPGDERPAIRGRRWPLLATLAGAAAVALVAGVFAGRQWLRPPAPPAAVVRSQIELPASAALLHFGRYGAPGAARTELALSPDGRLLVWSGSPDVRRQSAALCVRNMETGEVRRLPETAGAHFPFFSPDGQWIGYYSATAQMLRKVPTAGGLGVDLASFQGVDFPVANVGPMGASWAENGRVYLGSQSGYRGGIRSVSADGGKLEDVTRVERSRESGHRLPCALPGGRTLLFTAMPNAFGLVARIEALSLASGARKVVVDDAADPRYLPTGHLVFARQGTVMAAPFDLDRLELKAPPAPVIAGVHQALCQSDATANSGAAQLAVSATGLLVYAPGGIFTDPPAELVLAAPGGSVEPLPGFDRPLCTGQHRFSPDGRQLAFVERAASGLLWLFDVERQTQRQLTREGVAGFPVWSPDGSRVVVAWSKEGALNLWSVPAEGEDAWERLTTGEEHDSPSSWSPDGRVLAFVRGLEIFLLRLEGRQVVPFVTRPAGRITAFGYAEFSPDGRWLAYVSNETGRHEVYVTSFPDRGQTLAVSRDGGNFPAWSRDGRRLFYRSADRNAVMAVSVDGGARLSLGLPSIVLPTPANAIGLMPVGRLELHPDGRRFLFARERTPTVIPPVTRLELVQNWFTEVERLSPTGRTAIRR